MNTFSSFLSYVLLLVAVCLQVILFFVTFFVPNWLRKRKDISGQRVLITGAGSGLGRELAIEFSKHAVCLVLVDINKRSLLETEKLLDRRSAVFIYDCDVSDDKKVREMARKVREDAGDVDILVNNAGVVAGKYLTDMTAENIVKTFGVNALAHFWMCRAFLPSMMSRNSGHVVGVVSGLGKMPAPQLTEYCASKCAALGFAESLEIELREQGVDGVKMTVALLGPMDTGMFRGVKMRFVDFMSPEYVAREIVQGVLREEETVCVPSFLRNFFLIKEIVPRGWIIKVGALTGEIKGMKSFVGKDSTKEL